MPPPVPWDPTTSWYVGTQPNNQQHLYNHRGSSQEKKDYGQGQDYMWECIFRPPHQLYARNYPHQL